MQSVVLDSASGAGELGLLLRILSLLRVALSSGLGRFDGDDLRLLVGQLTFVQETEHRRTHQQQGRGDQHEGNF